MRFYYRAAQIQKGLAVGSEIKVFVYLDSEDRKVATFEQPLIMVNECAWLKVVDVTNVGAFLDWGLPKDLLLPFAEQKFTAEVGRKVLVKAYIDNSQRIAASTRIDEFLEEESQDFVEGQTVSLLIADKTELGFKAIVDHTHWGVLFANEIFQPLKKGQQITGYIKRIREDKRIDLTLSKPVREQMDDVSELIINVLRRHDGFMLVTDKSPTRNNLLYL